MRFHHHSKYHNNPLPLQGAADLTPHQDAARINVSQSATSCARPNVSAKCHKNQRFCKAPQNQVFVRCRKNQRFFCKVPLNICWHAIYLRGGGTTRSNLLTKRRKINASSQCRKNQHLCKECCNIFLIYCPKTNVFAKYHATRRFTTKVNAEVSHKKSLRKSQTQKCL